MLCAQYNGCVSVSNVLVSFLREAIAKMHHICVFRSGSLSLDDAIEFQACFFLCLSFSSPFLTFSPFIYVVQRLQTCTTTFFLPLFTLIFPLDDATGLEQWIFSLCSVRNRNRVP